MMGLMFSSSLGLNSMILLGLSFMDLPEFLGPSSKLEVLSRLQFQIKGYSILLRDKFMKDGVSCKNLKVLNFGLFIIILSFDIEKHYYTRDIIHYEIILVPTLSCCPN